MLTVSNLNVSISGSQILRGVNFTVPSNSVFCLMGRNGVGKTTLLRILLGELEPQTGTVRFGVNLEIAYFDQLRSEFDPTKTVAEIVAEGLDKHRNALPRVKPG